LEGADIATMPFGVFKELFSHKLTESGMVQFDKDTPKEFGELV